MSGSVVEHPYSAPPRYAGSGGGGNGNLTEHRLTELERRINSIDGELKKVNDICIEIRTLIKTLMWVGGGFVAVASIVIHVMLRASGT